MSLYFFLARTMAAITAPAMITATAKIAVRDCEEVGDSTVTVVVIIRTVATGSVTVTVTGGCVTVDETVLVTVVTALDVTVVVDIAVIVVVAVTVVVE